MAHETFPKLLLEGYENFRTNRYSEERGRYLKLGDGQKPKTMIIACCDSRAAPETIFNAGPGELFVVRNVANLVPPYAPDGKNHSTSAALEFAVIALEVTHIVVMGHAQCAGIKAACTHDFNPLSAGDFIGKWISDIKDVVTNAHMPHEATDSEKQMHYEHASVVHSLMNLRTFPWIASREREGKVKLHGAWFGVAQGELHIYDEAANSWDKI